jgi:hypothetical protein
VDTILAQTNGDRQMTSKERLLCFSSRARSARQIAVQRLLSVARSEKGTSASLAAIFPPVAA